MTAHTWTPTELAESLALQLALANASADDRDYARMRVWRDDRLAGRKPADSAMADLLPWYQGGTQS